MSNARVCRGGAAVLLGLAFLLGAGKSGEAGQPAVGVYVWAGADGVKNLKSRFLPYWGRTPSYAVDFAAFDSWGSFESSGRWVIGSWKGVVENLSLSVPLTVKGTSLQDVAAGRHDDSFRALARELVAKGFPGAVVRIGWEMNGSWYPWSNLGDADATRQGANIDAYKAAFAHVARLFHGVSPRFRINWCYAGGFQQVATPLLYPGDDVVDEIGMDLYATVWGTNHPTAAQVRETWNKGWQLDWLPAFAHSHGKPFSIPEFGVGDRPEGAANYGPGDNAEAARYAVGWLREHAPAAGQPATAGQLAWVGLWDVDAGDYNSQFTGGARPNVATAFRDLAR